LRYFFINTWSISSQKGLELEFIRFKLMLIETGLLKHFPCLFGQRLSSVLVIIRSNTCG